jgi:oligopeptide/dipeptide ABC transporter ATP-binding protein
MALVSASDITRTFDVGRGVRVHALNGVTIEVRKGECLAIIGESGSGKSTLGRILLGLIEPDSGTWKYHASDAAGFGHRRIQAVFQEPFQSLNPRHRIRAIVREPLDINARNLPRSERDERARGMLRLVGLSDEFHERLPHELSGGQQQRVGIARALVLQPEMLVLDEPTSSLDVSVRAQILDLLAELKARQGISMLYISHDIGSVERIADRVAVMYRGQIMETGETAGLLAEPMHPYSRALLSARLVPDPDVRTQPIKLVGEIPSQTSIPHHCLFAGRCPDEIPECRAGPIPMFRTGVDRESRCIQHRHDAATTAAAAGSQTPDRNQATNRSEE